MKATSYQMVSAIVMDKDTLQFGGSAFVRERTCRRIAHGLDRDRDVATVSWTCSECGGHMSKGDRYCPNCGAKVVEHQRRCRP